MYYPHTYDKRTTKYKNYLRQKAINLGLFTSDMFTRVLDEPRSKQDVYKIIMYLFAEFQASISYCPSKLSKSYYHFSLS